MKHFDGQSESEQQPTKLEIIFVTNGQSRPSSGRSNEAPKIFNYSCGGVTNMTFLVLVMYLIWNR